MQPQRVCGERQMDSAGRKPPASRTGPAAGGHPLAQVIHAVSYVQASLSFGPTV